jgi:hypothetical protein
MTNFDPNQRRSLLPKDDEKPLEPDPSLAEACFLGDPTAALDIEH